MLSLQARFGIGDPAWLDPTIAGAIFAVSIIVAVVFTKLLFPVVHRLINQTPTDLDSRLFRALRFPLTGGIVVLGAYLSLTVPLDLSGRQQDAVNTVGSVLAIILSIMAVASVVSSTSDWYVETVAPRTQRYIDVRLFPLFRRIAIVLIYGLGAVMILDQLGINISPLIAGLGLGGLAVALAIQPTLANLFAGTYVMTEGVLSAGDYVELHGAVSISGYVVDVGWRSVRIRTWGNNLVVIPNSRFADSIITNYQKPVPPVNVYLTCGISYDSDLYHVERICHEVMKEELDTNPSAVKEYGEYFGYDSFGDSNINFWLFLQAKDRLASFILKTSLIQRLQHRFRQEGIVINYPMRSLQLPDEWRPEVFLNRVSEEGKIPQAEIVPSAGEDAPGHGEGQSQE